MHLHEPPSSPDDTQPTFSRPTEPRRRQKARTIPTWGLVAIIGVSIVSLTATITLILQNREPISITPIRKAITLVVGSEVRDVETQAATIRDLLREQSIRLDSDDAISASPDTLLTDGMLVSVNRARTVTLRIDDEEQTIRTPFTNPQDILNNQEITLNPSDRVWLDGTIAEHSTLAQWPVPVNEMNIQRAVTVTIVDGNTETVIKSTADTVGDALFEAGITVYLTDSVTPALGNALEADTRITIDRARPVTIQVDGTSIETRVQGATVLDALSEAGIALIGLDYTMPAEGEPIEAGMTIHILRVTEATVSTEEPVPYEIIMQADATLELDQRRTIQAGQVGVRRIDERVRYENGIEVGREPAGSEVIQEPQNEIIAYGTNIVMRIVDTPQGPREYWRKLRVYATSYHPEALGGDNVTATGMTLAHGVIGSNPRIIPYHTEMYVPNYGIGVMADTGGARSSPYWIDLGYSDADYRSWHQYVDVYLLSPIPAEVNYLLPVWQPMNGIPDNG